MGSWTAEALARSGVETLTLIDLDDICVSNMNRQIHTLASTVGQPKIDAMRQRIQQINPECTVHCVFDFLTTDNAESLLAHGYDVVVDAIDSAKHKCAILSAARTISLPVVTVGGAGGRRDPSAWSIADLNRTKNDALLYRFARTSVSNMASRGATSLGGISCVYTTELPVFPTPDGETCGNTKPESPLRLDCSEGYGASTAVTGTAGFLAASAAIDVLLAPT